jgi:3-oxoacyl-[acyl-carrier protein] reductase
MNVIITGASRGIGFELVQQFLNAGDTVFCLTRNLEPLKTIVAS